jgi:hypothetical protein
MTVIDTHGKLGTLQPEGQIVYIDGWRLKKEMKGANEVYIANRLIEGFQKEDKTVMV